MLKQFFAKKIVIHAFLPCHSCEGRNRVYIVRSETEPNLPLPRHLRATPSPAKGINPPHRGAGRKYARYYLVCGTHGLGTLSLPAQG